MAANTPNGSIELNDAKSIAGEMTETTESVETLKTVETKVEEKVEETAKK